MLNSVVGAGIFGLPSRVFALAGVYSLFAYLLCAVLTFLIILCFAEVSSRFKDTGGPYLYARETFGPVVGFEIGWLSWLARITSFAALCNLFVDYLSYFLPEVASASSRPIVITLVVLFLTAANLVGVRLASLVGDLFTIGKLAPLIVLVLTGLFFVNPQSYSLAVAPEYRAFSASVLLLVFAFTGFEHAVIPAGEALDPRRDLPFALLTGTMIAALLYVGIQAVCIGTLPDLANSQSPLADAGARVFGRPGAAIIAFGALISVMGTMNAIVLAAPRLPLCHGRAGTAAGGDFSHPQALSHAPRRALHLRRRHACVDAPGDVRIGGLLSTIIRLITYAVTCAALPVLRRQSGRGAHRSRPRQATSCRLPRCF